MLDPWVPTIIGMLAWVATPETSLAQDTVWTRAGIQNVATIGRRVITLGDVDRDGFRDLMSICTVWYPPGLSETELWTFSGKDGSTLRTRREYEYLRPYINLAPVGDMDGDGIRDYITVITDQTSQRRNEIVEVRSWATDTLLWSATGPWSAEFGYAICGDLELDGDGRPDLVLSARPRTHNGAVIAYSNTGKILYVIPGSSQVPLGESLAKVGDVDGDGCDEYSVGCYDSSGWGAVALVSGRTGQVLQVGYGLPGMGIYVSSTGAGDVDGDGVPDFAGGGWSGVRAFSGRTGQPLLTFRSPAQQSDLGISLIGGIDLDQDGADDLIAGAAYEPPNAAAGVFYAISGRDGSVLFQILRSPQSSGLGYYSSPIGVEPGHAFPSFACVDLNYSLAGAWNLGRIRVIRGNPPGLKTFGSACAVSGARQPRLGVLDLGGVSSRFTVSLAPTNALALLLIGGSSTQIGPYPLPFDLGLVGWPGCTLYTSDELTLTIPTGTGSSAGFAAIGLPMRFVTQGWQAYGQGLVFDPVTGQGGATSAISFLFR